MRVFGRRAAGARVDWRIAGAGARADDRRVTRGIRGALRRARCRCGAIARVLQITRARRGVRSWRRLGRRIRARARRVLRWALTAAAARREADHERTSQNRLLRSSHELVSVHASCPGCASPPVPAVAVPVEPNGPPRSTWSGKSLIVARLVGCVKSPSSGSRSASFGVMWRPFRGLVFGAAQSDTAMPRASVERIGWC
jgi:hypothetical protein